LEALASIEHQADLPVAMLEEKLTLDVRTPEAAEVAKAKAYIAEKFPDREPQGWEEVYARATVLLSEMPKQRELRLHAIRVGDLGIGASPCEVYGSTGLAIKLESPFPLQMNISLANGYEGYIAPPSQFQLGGYTTWRNRTTALEKQAEPKIRAAILKMLRELR
jgi:hypothetical protein